MKFFIDKIKRNFSDYGFKTTVNKIISKIFGIIFETAKYRIYKKDLTLKNNINNNNKQNEFIIKIIKESDDDIINQIENEAEWLRDTLKKRIKNGDNCYCIFDNDQLIGYNIISFGKIFIPLVNYYKKFNKKCAWSEHISIKKEFRKKGLAIKLRKYVFNNLKDKGYNWLYGGCLKDNIASLKLARNLEFKEICDINYYKILGKKYWKIEKIKKIN